MTSKKKAFYMSRLFVLLLCLLAMTASCKKKTAEPPSPCADPDNAHCDFVAVDTAMHGFYFLPGTYWVYRNDTLNALDSVVVVSVKTGCEVLGLYLNMCVRADYFLMNFYSHRDKAWGYDIIEGTTLMRNWHPESVDWWKGWGLYHAQNAVIDSIQVGNNTFYNLQKSVSPGYIDPRNITAYTAKDIGIVKKIYPSGTGRVWNLVRWKINR